MLRSWRFMEKIILPVTSLVRSRVAEPSVWDVVRWLCYSEKNRSWLLWWRTRYQNQLVPSLWTLENKKCCVMDMRLLWSMASRKYFDLCMEVLQKWCVEGCGVWKAQYYASSWNPLVQYILDEVSFYGYQKVIISIFILLLANCGKYNIGTKTANEYYDEKGVQ